MPCTHCVDPAACENVCQLAPFATPMGRAELLRQCQASGQMDSAQVEAHVQAGEMEPAQITAPDNTRLIRLTVEEIAFLMNELTPGHDGSDFEAECPSCTAYRKLKAAVDWEARHGVAYGATTCAGTCCDCGKGCAANGVKASRNWWCLRCQREVPPEHVTYEEAHDPRFGGCDEEVVAERPDGVVADHELNTTPVVDQKPANVSDNADGVPEVPRG